MIAGACLHVFDDRISEKLRKTLSVLVFEEDLLPKRLCIDCCTTLEGFSQYKESVFDAQEKLKGISKNLSLTKDSNGQRLSDKEPAVYSHSKGSEEENISTTGSKRVFSFTEHESLSQFNFE